VAPGKIQNEIQADQISNNDYRTAHNKINNRNLQHKENPKTNKSDDKIKKEKNKTAKKNFNGYN
jgi:hypothetical protein